MIPQFSTMPKQNKQTKQNQKKQKKPRKKAYRPKADWTAVCAANPWMKNRVVVIPQAQLQLMKSMDRDALLRMHFGTGTSADFQQIKEVFAAGWLLAESILENPEQGKMKGVIAAGMGFMRCWREENRAPVEEEFDEFLGTYDAVLEFFAHAPVLRLSEAYRRVAREDELELPEAFVKGDPRLMSSEVMLAVHSAEEIEIRQVSRRKAAREDAGSGEEAVAADEDE